MNEAKHLHSTSIIIKSYRISTLQGTACNHSRRHQHHHLHSFWRFVPIAFQLKSRTKRIQTKKKTIKELHVPSLRAAACMWIKIWRGSRKWNWVTWSTSEVRKMNTHLTQNQNVAPSRAGISMTSWSSRPNRRVCAPRWRSRTSSTWWSRSWRMPFSTTTTIQRSSKKWFKYHNIRTMMMNSSVSQIFCNFYSKAIQTRSTIRNWSKITNSSKYLSRNSIIS